MILLTYFLCVAAATPSNPQSLAQCDFDIPSLEGTCLFPPESGKFLVKEEVVIILCALQAWFIKAVIVPLACQAMRNTKEAM